jgi:hypothetical protein
MARVRLKSSRMARTSGGLRGSAADACLIYSLVGFRRSWSCGRSSMAERQLPKLHTRVRFPSPAPLLSAAPAESFTGSFTAFVRAVGDATPSLPVRSQRHSESHVKDQVRRPTARALVFCPRRSRVALACQLRIVWTIAELPNALCLQAIQGELPYVRQKRPMSHLASLDFQRPLSQSRLLFDQCCNPREARPPCICSTFQEIRRS